MHTSNSVWKVSLKLSYFVLVTTSYISRTGFLGFDFLLPKIQPSRFLMLLVRTVPRESGFDQGKEPFTLHCPAPIHHPARSV